MYAYICIDCVGFKRWFWEILMCKTYWLSEPFIDFPYVPAEEN